MLTPPFPLQRRGANNFVSGNVPLGVTALVTGAANTTGLVVRSVVLNPPAAVSLNLRVGGVGMFTAQSGGVFNYVGPGIVVPPGQALEIEGFGSATGQAAITWDVLP